MKDGVYYRPYYDQIVILEDFSGVKAQYSSMAYITARMYVRDTAEPTSTLFVSVDDDSSLVYIGEV